MDEKYTLNWPTISDHLKWMFKDLYQEGRYTDGNIMEMEMEMEWNGMEI